MAKRIDTLTPEQAARMKPHAEQWINIGLSTQPADFNAFEQHARRCYELAGLQWPGIVIRVSSPLAAAWAVPLTAVVLGQVDGQVLGQVRGQVLGQVDDQVRDQVRGQVRGQVLREFALSSQFWGSQWWIGWIAWSTYFRDVCDLELAKDLWARVEPIEGAERTAWAWWPQKHYVVVCDRPSTINREQLAESGWNSHRLHCDTGPAVQFRDGYAVWAIHGVRVTEQIVMHPETITVDDIWAETNAEVRRVMIDQLGWDQFINLAALKLVDEQDDPGNPGCTIALYDVPAKVYDEPVRVILVTNASPERDGTRRRFGITVPANIDDAVAAAAWTFQLSRDTYADLARAT
jgi:hypothetical protein